MTRPDTAAIRRAQATFAAWEAIDHKYAPDKFRAENAELRTEVYRILALDMTEPDRQINNLHRFIDSLKGR